MTESTKSAKNFGTCYKAFLCDFCGKSLPEFVHFRGANKKGDLEVALSSQAAAVLPYSDASSPMLRQI
jgi:hypothetical protein